MCNCKSLTQHVIKISHRIKASGGHKIQLPGRARPGETRRDWAIAGKPRPPTEVRHPRDFAGCWPPTTNNSQLPVSAASNHRPPKTWQIFGRFTPQIIRKLHFLYSSDIPNKIDGFALFLLR